MVVSSKPKSSRSPETFLPQGHKGAPRASTAPRVASFRPQGRYQAADRPYRGRRRRSSSQVCPRSRRWPRCAVNPMLHDDLIRNRRIAGRHRRRQSATRRASRPGCYTSTGWTSWPWTRRPPPCNGPGYAPEESAPHHVLLLHQSSVDAVDGDLADRPAGHVPDSHVRRTSRPALCRLHTGCPRRSGCCRRSTPGAAGLRRSPRQDQHRAGPQCR